MMALNASVVPFVVAALRRMAELDICFICARLPAVVDRPEPAGNKRVHSMYGVDPGRLALERECVAYACASTHRVSQALPVRGQCAALCSWLTLACSARVSAWLPVI